MLPASQSPDPPATSTVAAANRWRLILAVASVVYALLVGIGLLSGIVSPVHAYLWMALLCLVPIAWYGYGFLRVREAEQDLGLLLSALGWALVLLALLIKHSNALSDRAAGATAAAAASTGSPAALICTVLALFCLLLGAALSWRAWTRAIAAGAGINE